MRSNEAKEHYTEIDLSYSFKQIPADSTEMTLTGNYGDMTFFGEDAQRIAKLCNEIAQKRLEQIRSLKDVK